MKTLSFTALLAAVLLAACTDDLTVTVPRQPSDAHELTGIRAEIDGSLRRGATRAGTVTPLADYVGRSEFVSGDKAVFTMIRRTQTPFEAFTYTGIAFNCGEQGGWSRDADDGGPERIYWTDATSPHTFIAYSIPQSYGEYWKKHTFQATENGATVSKTYYVGAIGNPTETTGDDAIVNYYIDPYEKETVDVTDNEGNVTDQKKVYKYRKLVNNDSVFTNPLLEHEDVVIAYDEEMLAEPGGSVALVRFRHALSSIRVVVNISGFSSSSTAVDNQAVVWDMVLKHQPTMYAWKQTTAGAQPLRNASDDLDGQDLVDYAWGTNGPRYVQRKDMKLWIPKPEGVGSNQNKTFTFYGITTPQPEDYMTNLKDGGDTENTRTVLQFNVTYPDPMNPAQKTTKPYTATLDDVYYEAGYNTTINISLNHRNEEMTVGAEYENWQFVATPDHGALSKKSTFLQDTTHDGLDASIAHPNVTIVTDDKATVDDATWLYNAGTAEAPLIKDIYGHTGTSVEDAYQISTAYQLVSFAYEVASGRDFTGQYVRLDADITLQKSSDKVKEEYVLTDDNTSAFDAAEHSLSWIGIGDDGHAFNGTFLGGHRYIYRLSGKPLFARLGPQAKVKQLNVSAIAIGNGTTAAVDGGGLFAEQSEGRISGCRVVGDVTLGGNTGSYAGAFVGQNFIGSGVGALYASYHVGDTKSTGSTHVGGLVGNNGNGIISGCFQAGVVAGGTEINRGIAGVNTGDNIYNTYFNSSLFHYSSPSTNVMPRTSAEMTKQQFVDDLNKGLEQWSESHTDYDPYRYVHQPANYPKLSAE